MATYTKEQAMEYSKNKGYTQDNVSQADWNLLEKDPDRFISLINYKIDFSNAKTAQERQSIHQKAEQLRGETGYSGGTDGSGYYKTGETPRDFTYQEAPSFSYSAEEDPLFQTYKKQYLREGQRAAEDALGNAAATTGGIASSHATAAAAQAGGYYAAHLADKVPELYQAAYSRHTQDMSHYNTDKAFAYQQHMAGIQNDDKLYDRAWEQAEQKAGAGDFTDYDKLGVNTSQNPNILSAAAKEQEYKLEKAKIALEAGNYDQVEQLLGFQVNSSDKNSKLLLQAALSYAKIGDYSLLGQLVGSWQ